jgi:hypothetical protein
MSSESIDGDIFRGHPLQLMVSRMFIRRKIATIRLRVITLLNRWLSPEPPPFYGWPDDDK